MTLWQPDPTSLRRPAYLSLAEQIARAIADGKLEGGARLPTHRRMADDLRLSVQTVSRAYEELIRRNLISGETGRGTFVCQNSREPDPPYLPERLGEVIDLFHLEAHMRANAFGAHEKSPGVAVGNPASKFGFVIPAKCCFPTPPYHRSGMAARVRAGSGAWEYQCNKRCDCCHDGRLDERSATRFEGRDGRDRASHIDAASLLSWPYT